MDGEISFSSLRKTRSTRKDQPKSASIRVCLYYRQELAVNVPIRATLYLTSDNDRGSGTRFAEILLIFLIFEQAVSTHLNGSTRMW